MNNYESIMKHHIESSMGVKETIMNDSEILNTIKFSALEIAFAFRNGNKVMFCGNGGSAADSQHISAEFSSVLSMDCPRPGLPSIALTTDTSFLTANANDYGFEGGFARAVQALGKKGDVLVGISTSGNSKNVVKAFEQAKEMGIKTISWTGLGGGKLLALSDQNIAVPSKTTQYIQESHIMIGHIICDLVERELGYRNV